MSNDPIIVGRYDATIDSSGRVKLPEEWDFAFGSGKLIFLIPDANGRFLSIIPSQAWEKSFVGLRERVLFDPKVNAALRKIGEESRMYMVSPDGTIELDSTILERARLKSSVSFIGCCRNAKLYATETLPPDGASLL